MSNIYNRNNLRWTTSEDRRLEELFTKQKYSFKKIATDLHRSVDGIQARFVKQVLCSKYSPEYMLANKEALAKHHNIPLEDFERYLKYAGIRPAAGVAEGTTHRYNTRSTRHVRYDDIISEESDTTWDSSDDDYEEDNNYMLANIMKSLDALHEKIDKLDKKYR